MISDVKYKHIEDIIGSLVSMTSGAIEGQLMMNDENITGLHFLHGSYNVIRNRLQERSESGTEYKFRRYPLIALFQDIPIEKGIVGTNGTVTLQIMILAHTTAEMYNEDRLERVFKPTLYPILEEFKRQIRDSGYFTVRDTDSIRYTEIKRYHWGDPGLYGNNGYLFGDCLDGVEMKNLQLTLY